MKNFGKEHGSDDHDIYNDYAVNLNLVLFFTRRNHDVLIRLELNTSYVRLQR